MNIFEVNKTLKSQINNNKKIQKEWFVLADQLAKRSLLLDKLNHSIISMASLLEDEPANIPQQLLNSTKILLEEFNKLNADLDKVEACDVAVIDEKRIVLLLEQINKEIEKITDPQYQLPLACKERLLDVILGFVCVIGCIILFVPLIFLGFSEAKAQGNREDGLRFYKRSGNALKYSELLADTNLHQPFAFSQVLFDFYLNTGKYIFQAYSGKKYPAQLQRLYEIETAIKTCIEINRSSIILEKAVAGNYPRKSS